MILSLTPAKDLFDRVQRDFSMPLKDRLLVVAEVEKYRWKEDESVWRQKREKDPYSYEVYFDGEFVCDFSVKEEPDMVYYRVMKNIRDLYKAKKIFFNKQMYEIKRAEEAAKRKAEEPLLPKIDAPEHKIIQEVIKRQRRRRANRAK